MGRGPFVSILHAQSTVGIAFASHRITAGESGFFTGYRGAVPPLIGSVDPVEIGPTNFLDAVSWNSGSDQLQVEVRNAAVQDFFDRLIVRGPNWNVSVLSVDALFTASRFWQWDVPGQAVMVNGQTYQCDFIGLT